MANGLIIGIDPGFTGAIAIVEAKNGYCDVKDVYDMPLKDDDDRPLVDCVKLKNMLNIGAKFLVVEKAQSSPQMGVTSSFRYGEGYGMICGVALTLGIRTIPVVPAVWKKHMHLDFTKDKSRVMAEKLFPHQSVLFIKKKDHGRAEAALLALFGYQKFGKLLMPTLEDFT